MILNFGSSYAILLYDNCLIIFKYKVEAYKIFAGSQPWNPAHFEAEKLMGQNFLGGDIS